MTNSAETGDTGILAGYLTEADLADEFGVSRATIRKWKSLGEAPTVTRVGRKIFYARTDVRNWLLSRRLGA